MQARNFGWLLISTAAVLFGACGGDDDSGDDTTPSASGSGGEGGSPTETGGEAGASIDGIGGGVAGAGGAPPAAIGGQGGSDPDPAGGAGGELMEPAEVVIASAQEGPTGIALDDDYVYWANQDAGTIVRCPLAGCGNDEPTELVSDQIGVRGISVDATSVYWIRPPELDNTTRIRKCPLAGCDGEPEVLAEFPYENPNDNDVHVDGDLFYYSAWPDFGTCPLSGCDSDQVSWAPAPAVSIDTDSQYMYVAKYGFRQIHRCDLPDCTNNVILVSETVPLSVAVDETTLYFAAFDVFASFGPADVHAILKCPIDGCGTDEPEVVRDDISPYAVAVNEERLFFTDVEQGTVTSLAK
jgi:hypothetical protein